MSRSHSTASGIDEIVRQLQSNCAREFDDARAMPPAVYTSRPSSSASSRRSSATNGSAWAAPARSPTRATI